MRGLGAESKSHRRPKTRLKCETAETWATRKCRQWSKHKVFVKQEVPRLLPIAWRFKIPSWNEGKPTRKRHHNIRETKLHFYFYPTQVHISVWKEQQTNCIEMHNSQIYFWCWLWLRHVAKKSRIWNGFSGFPEAWGRTTTTIWPTVQLTNKKKIHYSHFNCTHTDFNWPKFATKIPSSIFDLKFPPCPSEEATKPRRENKSFQIDFTLTTLPCWQIISKESLFKDIQVY